MELLEQRQMLAADFDLSSGDSLKINVLTTDAEVYLRTEPQSHQMQYRYSLSDTWQSEFNGETVHLDSVFQQEYPTGFNIDVDYFQVDTSILDAPNAVVILSGFETSDSSLSLTSSIDVHVSGDIVTGIGDLVVELKDSVRIFGGSGLNNSSVLSIGPLDPSVDHLIDDQGFETTLGNPDRNGDDLLSLNAGKIKLKVTQQSQKSVKQVIGFDNQRASVAINDATFDSLTYVEIDSKASADLLGDDEGAWGNYYSQYVGYFIDATMPHVPFSLFYRQAESQITLRDTTIKAAGDISINNKSVATAKGKAIAAKPAWSADNAISADVFSAGATASKGSAVVELLGSHLISSAGSIKVNTSTQVTSDVVARTTNNIGVGSPAETVGFAFTVTYAETTAHANLDESSSILAHGNVGFTVDR